MLVHNGRLSGIVDVDTVCYGDPLFALALTRAASTACGFDSVYVDAWRDLLELEDEQLVALSFYTALFCLDLLSEAGHCFNRPLSVTSSAARTKRLHHLFDSELRRIT